MQRPNYQQAFTEPVTTVTFPVSFMTESVLSVKCGYTGNKRFLGDNSGGLVMDTRYDEGIKGYIENSYHIAYSDFKCAKSEEEQWEARKTMARLEELALQVFKSDFFAKLRQKELGT